MICLRLITWLFVFFSTSLCAAECKDAIAPDKAIARFQMIGINYPEETTFEEWLERKETKVTCRLFKRLGWAVDIQYFPVKRAFAEMAAGHADMMGGADYLFTPEVRRHMKLVRYRSYKIATYYYDKKRRSDEPERLGDFEGKVVAVGETVSASRFAISAKKAGVDVTIFKTADHKSRFNLLRLGRADYTFMSSDDELKSFIEGLDVSDNQNNKGHFFEVYTPLEVQQAGMVFNMNRPGAERSVSYFEAALHRLRNESGFLALVEGDSSFVEENFPRPMIENTILPEQKE